MSYTRADAGLVDALSASLSEPGAHGGHSDAGDAGALLQRARAIGRSLLPLGSDADIERLAAEAVAHTSGLGPLQELLADPAVDEVMVNNGGEVWIEREGTISRVGVLAADVTPRIIERIISPLGRRLDRLSPIVDARLADGTRVCAVIPPVAVDGACLTMRRFGVRRRSIGEFSSAPVAELLAEIIDARCNVLISGATSSGKTSLLNALASIIDPGERLITLEDTAELSLDAEHVVRLETRPATVDGTPEISMTDLVRTAMRLRPDRIVVGEVRGAEVIDMLGALNTGHRGSLTTCHANSPLDALRRIESLVLQHSPAWPLAAVRDTIAASIDVVVHVRRSTTGARHVADITEVAEPGSGSAHRELVVDGVVFDRRRRSGR